MPRVNPLTSVKRTTEVTGTSTNITMMESIKSPEQGQYELRMKELDGQTKAAVAKANRPSFGSWLFTPAYYGGYPNYGDNYGGNAVNGTPGGYVTPYGGGGWR